MIKSNQTMKTIQSILIYSIVLIFTFLTVFPLIWLFFSSFKTQADIALSPFALPLPATVQNYIEAWTRGNMLVAFMNSVVFSFVSTVITILFALMASFSLTKFSYNASKYVYSFFTLGLLITVNSVIAPLFFLETRLGLYNSYTGIILPYIAFGLPMAILLGTSYIKGIPDSLIEAAKIDGATYWKIFFTVILPISTPIIGTIAVLTFLKNWNEFTLVFVLTSGESIRSLPVAINSFAGRLNVDYGMQFAALVIGTIPMILFYIFSRDLLIKGFGEGALKE